MGRISFVLCALLFAACATKPERLLDASTEADSSTAALDASQTSDSAVLLDAAVSEDDGSSAALDAALDASLDASVDATTLADSGLVIADGGLVFGDLGIIVRDGGLVRLDAEIVEPTADLSAPPVCLNDGTRSEGWYSSVNGVLICWADCHPLAFRVPPTAEARNCGGRGAGWYAPEGSGDCVSTTGNVIARTFLACE